MPTQARTVHQLGRQIEQCIEHCQKSHQICLETITYCLEMGDQHANASHIRLLLDCAEVCQSAANFMVRNSEFHTILCSPCAEICLRCAKNCESFVDDDLMKNCAAACHRSAESCQLMASSAPTSGKS